MLVTTIDFSQLAPTRDYLQDIIKVVGKVQQAFLPPNEHEWHKGLAVTSDGIMTQPLQTTAGSLQIVVNLLTGSIQLDQEKWQLGNVTATELLDELKVWAKPAGAAKEIETPELTGRAPTFNATQASILQDTLLWARDQLGAVKRTFTRGSSSPILLYPHHFDLSMTWYFDSSCEMTFGFSGGDDNVQEPYFYVTEYPESEGFKQHVLPQPATWQTVGFSGAIITYNNAMQHSRPDVMVQDFMNVLIN